MSLRNHLQAGLRRGFGALRALFPTRLPLLMLVFFLGSGELKGDPRLSWIPVDLTLLSAAALVGMLILAFRRGQRLNGLQPLILMGLWFLTFLPGVIQAAGTSYAGDKVMNLLTLTALSAFAGMLLFRDEEDLRGLPAALALLGLIYSVEAVKVLFTKGASADGRLMVFGATTITLGRMSTFLFLYAVLHLLDPREGAKKPAALVLMALGGFAALSSGSRGPLVAGVASLVLLYPLFRGPKIRLWSPKTALVVAALPFAVGASLTVMPKASVYRILSFTEGRIDSSEEYRKETAIKTFEVAQEHPLGLGLGSFPFAVEGSVKGTGRQYPHNHLLEMMLECGWACALMALVLWGASLLRLWPLTDGLPGRLAACALVYTLVNALVSGDLNDNRPLYTFLSLGLVAPAFRRRTLPSPEQT